MEKKDIIKLDEYAGISISVGGCMQLAYWSHLEEKKADIYLKLSEIEYKTAKIIQNQMKERHLGTARCLLQESKDALDLSKLLNALLNKWVERLDEGVKRKLGNPCPWCEGKGLLTDKGEPLSEEKK